MARIIVSGAAGFIGSHTVESLLSRGHDLVGLDDFNPYYDIARKRANLREVDTHPRSDAFRMVEGTILDPKQLKSLFAEHKPSTMVHLAAMPGVGASLHTPSKYVDINIQGTLNVLEAAREAGTQNVVLASTSSVYGNSTRVPFREEDPADRPLAPYAASKRAAELLAHTYHHLYGMNVTILRFFTVYGPRNRPDMMAYKVLDSIMNGREIPLYDNGKMYRDWTFVGDTVAGITAAVDHPQGYEVINLGRGEPVLVSDFVSCIENLAGRKARLVAQPRKEFDATSTHADISKARRLLGYKPQTTVEDGVAKLWSWYQRMHPVSVVAREAHLEEPAVRAPGRLVLVRS